MEPLFDRVLPEVLRLRAEQDADRTFFQSVGGSPVTYGEAYRRASSIAHGLVDLEVAHGDTVVIMADSSDASICTWLGIFLAGAVEVAINTGYRNRPLVHALQNSQAKVIVVAAEFLPALEAVHRELTFLQTVVVIGTPGTGRPPSLGDRRILPLDSLTGGPPTPPHRPVGPHDLAAIVYTSGTTGPAKGVMMPHGQISLFARLGVEGARMTEADKHYCFVPLYHVAGKYMGIYASMIAGGSAIIDTKFSAEVWLPRCRAYGATLSHVHGPLVEMIHKLPEQPDDADNPVTRIVSSPFPAKIAVDFERRFGLRGIECWGMTEVCVPIWQPYDEDLRVGCCGRVRDEHFEFRIIDGDTDEELPAGRTGEFALRPKTPFTIMQGYLRSPDATLAAWRNLWFHTGDQGYVDQDGYVYFVDRAKERIRRRAENISSYDIEAAALLHPAVRECAAVGVPSEFEGDDDIKLCVILTDGAALPPEELIGFVAKQLPHFMVPRYLAFMDEFARTSVGKVQKASLRAAGIGPGTWDRKAAGVELKSVYGR